MWKLILCHLVLWQFLDVASSSRIIGIFPHGARSHFNMVGVLMEGLVKKGHEVVVVSRYPRKTPLKGYTDITLEGLIHDLTNEIPLVNVGDGSVGTTLGTLFNLGFESCERILSQKDILKLTQVKFDLVIYEMFNTDCFLALVQKFNAPYIAISSSAFMPWHNDRFGNIDNPSYVPVHFLPHSDRMNYKQRFMNSVYYAAIKWVTHFSLDGPTVEIVKKTLGDSGPPLHEIAKNTSLLLLNTHFTLNRPRPFVPAIIEVGGIHMQDIEKLPPKIETFLDEAKHGAIYFSFGSTVKLSTLPTEMRNAFLKAFAELPQRVIWKWEGDLPGKPSNIMVDAWLPQMAILNHPKVRLYISHAGLCGTMEAVAAGVPMVGIPLFGDQPLNLAALIENGVAVRLDYQNLTKDNILTAIRTVLDNPSYAENSKRLQSAFNDRPLPPLQTAIYWVEYVIRHNGSPYMRMASVDLAWYENILLDILVPVAGAVLLVTILFYLMVKKLFVCVFGGFNGSPAADNSKKVKQKKN